MSHGEVRVQTAGWCDVSAAGCAEARQQLKRRSTELAQDEEEVMARLLADLGPRYDDEDPNMELLRAEKALVRRQREVVEFALDALAQCDRSAAAKLGSDVVMAAVDDEPSVVALRQALHTARLAVSAHTREQVLKAFREDTTAKRVHVLRSLTSQLDALTDPISPPSSSSQAGEASESDASSLELQRVRAASASAFARATATLKSAASPLRSDIANFVHSVHTRTRAQLNDDGSDNKWEHHRAAVSLESVGAAELVNEVRGFLALATSQLVVQVQEAPSSARPKAQSLTPRLSGVFHNFKHMLRSASPSASGSEAGGGGDGDGDGDGEDGIPLETELRVYMAVENALMPHVFGECVVAVGQKSRDEWLQAQCQRYGHLTQEQIGVDKKFRCGDIVPYSKALAKLKTLFLARTPTKLLNIIVSAAESVFAHASELTSAPMGCDDFTDVWIHLLLRANIPNLCSLCEYIQTFAHPSLLSQGQLAYYLLCLTMATEYISSLSDDKLRDIRVEEGLDQAAGGGQDAVQAGTGRFVVCERARFAKWATGGKQVRVVSEGEWVEGYRVVVVGEWWRNDGKFVWAVPMHTGDPNDRVCVSALQANDSATPAQLQLLDSIFFSPAAPLSTASTSHGTMLVIDPGADHSTLSLVPIAGGDVDAIGPHVDTALSLSRLGCPALALVGKSTPVEMLRAHAAYLQQTFAVDFSAPEQEGGDGEEEQALAKLTELVKTLQRLLVVLNFLPILFNASGVVDTMTAMGLQRCYQEGLAPVPVPLSSPAFPLHANTAQTVSPELWAALQARLQHGCAMLGRIVEGAPELSVRNLPAVSDALKTFQARVGMFADGRMGVATIKRLEEASS